MTECSIWYVTGNGLRILLDLGIARFRPARWQTISDFWFSTFSCISMFYLGFFIVQDLHRIPSILISSSWRLEFSQIVGRHSKTARRRCFSAHCARHHFSGVLGSDWALETTAQVCFGATQRLKCLSTLLGIRPHFRFSFEMPFDIALFWNCALLRAVLCATSQTP